MTPRESEGGNTLAFDLGGTQLRAAILNSSLEILQRESLATDAQGGPRAIIQQMTSLAERLMKYPHAAFTAVGISAPGPLDSTSGKTLSLPTLPGWEDFPLRDELSARLSLPVVLENDGISAACGEWKHGAGRGHNNLVYVTVSTGIGGGVIVDGKVLRGRRGMAGHVGHMMIDPSGPICPCGGKGCLEAFAAGPALNRIAQQNGFADAAEVVTAARQRNAQAMEIISREAEYLGYGFASLLHLYSPEILIMGGGVSNALDLMYPKIMEQIHRHAMPSFREVKLVAAQLGDNAGLIGAAVLARA
jgi:glucokinase